MERDNRELERSLEVERETSVRKSAEMEKMNRKLTATIHADKKEIARLKEVCGFFMSPVHIKTRMVFANHSYKTCHCISVRYGKILHELEASGNI